MTLDERLAKAAHRLADDLAPPEVDLDRVRARARANQRRNTALVVAAAVVGVIMAATAIGVGVARENGAQPSPVGPPSPTPSKATSGPIDVGTWTPYAPKGWDDFEDGALMGYPPDWTVVPATREWRFNTDAADPLSPAHESFVDPTGDIRVSLWEVPCADLTDGPYPPCVETVDYVLAWADDYCTASGIATPCSGIEDRAIRLCIEKRDCHPGVLVRFDSAVLAFLKGPIHNTDDDGGRGVARRLRPIRCALRRRPAAPRRLPVDHADLARLDSTSGADSGNQSLLTCPAWDRRTECTQTGAGTTCPCQAAPGSTPVGQPEGPPFHRA